MSVAQMLTAFEGAGDGVALYREDVSGVSAYWLMEHLGAGNYYGQQLYSRTTSGHTIHTLNHTQIKRPFTLVDQDESGYVRTGTWSLNATAGAAATYGGTYDRNNSGGYVTYTTPASVTALYFLGVRIVNAGIALVTIDGDRTAANLCQTAQQLVDAGTLVSTALVANGGSLNPTDRVIDQYALTTIADFRTPIADNLSAGSHTLVITNTGYKHTSATDVRLYVSGIGYSTAAIRAGDAGIVLLKTHDIFSYSAGSVSEYALQVDGTTWCGNAHGYDSQTSLTLTVDGATQTPADLAIVAGTTSIVVTRVSNLYSADVGGGSTVVGVVTTTYTMHPTTGLEVSASIAWAGTYTINVCYAAMMPVDDGLDTGRNMTTGAEETLTHNDEDTYLIGQTPMLLMWDANGVLGELCYIPDVVTTLGNYAYVAPSSYPFVQDRSTPVNKAYFARVSGTGMSEAVTGSTTWTLTSQRRGLWDVDIDGAIDAALIVTVVGFPVRMSARSFEVQV